MLFLITSLGIFAKSRGFFLMFLWGVLLMEEKSRPQERLNEKEIKLIKLLRAMHSGEVRIIVQDKLPIRVEELHRSIELK